MMIVQQEGYVEVIGSLMSMEDRRLLVLLTSKVDLNPFLDILLYLFSIL